MKHKIAWLGVILSTLYLLTIGILPDPIPFVDEGVALAVLLKCSAYLGYDLRKWLPYFPGKGKSAATKRKQSNKSITIDV